MGHRFYTSMSHVEVALPADLIACRQAVATELLDSLRSSMASSRYAAAHASPAGPGDARPTAADVVKDEGMTGKLGGKVFFITGCSAGIGVETARALIATGISKTLPMMVIRLMITVLGITESFSVASGADLYLTARDMQKGQKVLQDLQASSSDTHGKVELLHLELDSLQSVRDCAECFLKKSKTLNVLINNAGMLATSSAAHIAIVHPAPSCKFGISAA